MTRETQTPGSADRGRCSCAPKRGLGPWRMAEATKAIRAWEVKGHEAGDPEAAAATAGGAVDATRGFRVG